MSIYSCLIAAMLCMFMCNILIASWKITMRCSLLRLVDVFRELESRISAEHNVMLDFRKDYLDDKIGPLMQCINVGTVRVLKP